MTDYDRVVEYVRNYVSKNKMITFTDEEILQIVNSIGTNYSGILAGEQDFLISFFESSINFDKNNTDEEVRLDEDSYSVPNVFGNVYSNIDSSSVVVDEEMDVLRVFDRRNAARKLEGLMDEYYQSAYPSVLQDTVDDKTTRIFKVISERKVVPIDVPSSLFRRGTTEGEIKEIVSRLGDEVSKTEISSNSRGHFNQDDISSLVSDEPIQNRINRGIEKNRREIAEFLRKRNEDTRKKMYGDMYKEPSNHYGEDDVISVVKTSNLRINEKKRNEILKYVEWLLISKSRYMFDTSLDIGTFAEKIVKKLETQNINLYNDIYKCLEYTEYKAVKNDEFFQFINNLIKKEIENNKDIEFNIEFKEAKKYILNYITRSKRYDSIVNYQMFIDDVAINLVDDLMRRGRRLKDIKNGSCLSYIDSEIRKDVMYRKSCGNNIEDENDKTKKEIREFKLTTSNFMRNKIARNTAAVVLGILIFSNTTSGIELFDKVEDTLFPSQYSETISELKNFDNYEYPAITGAEDKSFIDTYSHLVHIFPEYAKHNQNLVDNYEQICLYEAYKSINDANPRLMDNLLSIMRSNYQKTGDNDSEWLLSSNASFVDSSNMCYPVYVYVMMHEGGVDVSEYANAVKAYADEGGINKISTQHQKSIKEMMREYGEFVQELQNEFVNLPTVKNRGVSK